MKPLFRAFSVLRTSWNEMKWEKLFLLGLFVKLACMPFFAAHQLNNLFIPFLDNAVMNPLANPWSAMSSEYFPYGSALYLLLFLPRLLAYKLFGAAILGNGAIGIVLVKLPLLLVDILVLLTLLQYSPKQKSRLLLYYWCNPALFFITYILGQLDVAVTAFTLLSILLLLRRHLVLSAATMAFALLSKFNSAILIPYILAFLWNRNFQKPALRQMSVWLGVLLVISVAGFLPLLLAQKIGGATATSPQALSIFAFKVLLAPNALIYPGIALLMALLGRLLISHRIDEEGLLFGSAMLLGGLLLITDAQPGWYYWFFPFSALLFANYANAPRSLYWLSIGLYLLHFVLLPQIMPDAGEIIRGMSFTLLQTSVAGILFSIWFLAAQRSNQAQRAFRPLLLGIAGNSGAGKNHLTSLLSDVFDRKNTLVIEGDDYHRWERGNKNWMNITHLDPKANRLRTLAVNTASLVSGRHVEHEQYDHGSGHFTKQVEYRHTKTVIVQGLHSLYLRDMRKRLDISIFLHPDPLVNLTWKIQRDVKERGHSLQHVLDSIKKREADTEQHILPQMSDADWIIEYVPAEPFTREQALEGKLPKLKARHLLWNDCSVIDFFQSLNDRKKCHIEMSVAKVDSKRVALELYSGPDAETIARIAEETFPSLRQLTRAQKPPQFSSGIEGLSQLMALCQLEQMHENR